LFRFILAGLLLAPPPLAAQGTRVAEHVVIISVDGLRPDAIERYPAHTLWRRVREGAYSLRAQTISPSKTLPSHTSMLTGLPPSDHGVTWNSDQTSARGMVEATTVFEVAKGEGLHTAAFFSKSKFHHLQKPGTLDHTEAPSGLVFLMATETVEATVRYLKHERPNLLFVHIAEPDYAGHAVGWMSFVYGWAVRRADAAVARVLEAAEEAFGSGNFTVIVTADHGGHGRTHGTEDPRDMTIPWIAWGRAVRAGEIPDGETAAAGSDRGDTPKNAAKSAVTVGAARPIRTMDTAATALWLLGVGRPESWVGEPVRAAFVERATAR
jgi:predicted AlkP superfamily pyrophosphatase or phosphodiesterase